MRYCYLFLSFSTVMRVFVYPLTHASKVEWDSQSTGERKRERGLVSHLFLGFIDFGPSPAIDWRKLSILVGHEGGRDGGGEGRVVVLDLMAPLWRAGRRNLTSLGMVCLCIVRVIC